MNDDEGIHHPDNESDGDEPQFVIAAEGSARRTTGGEGTHLQRRISILPMILGFTGWKPVPRYGRISGQVHRIGQAIDEVNAPSGKKQRGELPSRDRIMKDPRKKQLPRHGHDRGVETDKAQPKKRSRSLGGRFYAEECVLNASKTAILYATLVK